MPRGLFGAGPDSHVDVAAAGGADGAAGVLVHHEAGEVPVGGGVVGAGHIDGEKGGEGARVDGHVDGFIKGFVGGNGGAGGDGDVERAKGAAGALGEEDGAVIEVEIFVLSFGMGGEIGGQGS